MAIETPPIIDPAPVPGPQRGDESTFDDRMDAKILWDETSAEQYYDSSVNVAHNAQEAYNSALAAGAQAVAASGFADAAHGSAQDAEESASDANASATNAANSAAASAASAVALVANSSSSVAVGNGSKVFTVPAGKQFAPGIPMVIASISAPANRMFGTPASYSETTLTMTITKFEGTGTFNDWVISTSGAEGPAGGITGGNLTGSLNELRGADVASATTIDPWASGGNYEVLTGTVPVIAFAPAPQAGARRRLLAAAATPITAGTNLIIKGIPSGQTYICAPGDEIEVVAETTTKFRVTVKKADGTAMAAMFGSFTNVALIDATGVYVAKKTGWHRIRTIGGGARGGVCTSSAASARATGAGGPAYCEGMRFLIKGVSYTCIIGAGASSISVGVNTTQAGADGADTTFSGSGIVTMTAGGGKGGAATASATALAGGLGGVATGGDINVDGGAGGDIIGTGGGRGATGAGACGISGSTYKGGNATPAAAATSTATGGAAPGGVSGDASNGGFSGGAGYGGPSPNRATSGAGVGGPNYRGDTFGSGAAQAVTHPSTQVLENATGGGGGANSLTGVPDGGAAGASVEGTLLLSGYFTGWPGIIRGSASAVESFGTAKTGSSTGGIAWYSSSTATFPGAASGRIYIES